MTYSWINLNLACTETYMAGAIRQAHDHRQDLATGFLTLLLRLACIGMSVYLCRYSWCSTYLLNLRFPSSKLIPFLISDKTHKFTSTIYSVIPYCRGIGESRDIQPPVDCIECSVIYHMPRTLLARRPSLFGN